MRLLKTTWRVMSYCCFATLLLIQIWLNAAKAADDSSELDPYTIAGHLIFATKPIAAKDLFGDVRMLRARSNIFVADLIRVDATSHAQFRLRDGAIFEARSQTELTISDFSPHEGKALARSVLYLHRGHVQFFVGLESQASPSIRIIKTPVGWLETQNALFSVSMSDMAQLRVEVSSGQVRVTNQKGSLVIGENQAFQVAHVGRVDVMPKGGYREKTQRYQKVRSVVLGDPDNPVGPAKKTR